MTAKEQILEFIKHKKYARTSEVIRFASSIYSNRGDRNARQLAQEGRIRRLTDEEKKKLFGKIHEDIWAYIEPAPVIQKDKQGQWEMVA